LLRSPLDKLIRPVHMALVDDVSNLGSSPSWAINFLSWYLKQLLYLPSSLVGTSRTSSLVATPLVERPWPLNRLLILNSRENLVWLAQRSWSGWHKRQIVCCLVSTSCTSLVALPLARGSCSYNSLVSSLEQPEVPTRLPLRGLI